MDNYSVLTSTDYEDLMDYIEFAQELRNDEDTVKLKDLLDELDSNLVVYEAEVM